MKLWRLRQKGVLPPPLKLGSRNLTKLSVIKRIEDQMEEASLQPSDTHSRAEVERVAA